MSNHKWGKNVCVRCGISRERKEYRKWQSTGSVLGRDGCWHDKTYYTYGTGWYYGKEYGFERPQCALVELANSDIQMNGAKTNEQNETKK